MRRGWLGNGGAAIAVLLMLVVGGCAARSGGGVFDGSTGVEGEGAIGDEGIPGERSIEQFEETGMVAAGGDFMDVRFAFDSDRIDGPGHDAIAHNAAILDADPGRDVEIEGHTDERGSSEYNLALGARRARAVRDALVGMGIASDRLSTVSYGEELPLCKESNESCWSMNRRVHVVDLGR